MIRSQKSKLGSDTTNSQEKTMLQRALQLAEERAYQAKLQWEKELLQDPRLLMFKVQVFYTAPLLFVLY